MLTLELARSARDEWGFNCGPAALCAVLGMTPNEVRPHLGDFEQKEHTNPTLMADILRRLKVPFDRVFESSRAPHRFDIRWPGFGLVRIQWEGPWTEPGRPMRARYRHTHWIASKMGAPWGHRIVDPHSGHFLGGHKIFDVNALVVGGWISFAEWESVLVPWLLERDVPKATGKWWPTHCWNVQKEGSR